MLHRKYDMAIFWENDTEDLILSQWQGLMPNPKLDLGEVEIECAYTAMQSSRDSIALSCENAASRQASLTYRAGTGDLYSGVIMKGLMTCDLVNYSESWKK